MAAMKLLSVVGVATAVMASSVASASAVSSSVSTSLSSSSSSSSSIRSPAAAAAAAAAVSSSTRSLQDANGNTYAYLDDVSGYQLQYSNCVRVKVPTEYDDDAAEGNVNFYNGRYHAQYQIFATFHVCGDGSYNNDDGGGDQCNNCDFGVEYASEVGDYLETTLDFYEEYCEACKDACGGGRRGRRLEDEDGAANDDVDCNTCSDQCMTYYQGEHDDAVVDESSYVECDAGAVDDDGIQLYYGPQCSDDGRIVVGVFYDDECTIKTKHDAPEFDYYKFGAVVDGCLDCSTELGGESCDDLYGESYHCLNGKDQTGEDEMSICSTVKKATTKVDYSGVRKRHHGKDAFIKVFFGLLAVGGMGGFFFLAYTYFIRHRGEKSMPMLSSEDVHEELDQRGGGSGGSGAPPGATLT